MSPARLAVVLCLLAAALVTVVVDCSPGRPTRAETLLYRGGGRVETIPYRYGGDGGSSDSSDDNGGGGGWILVS